jgi:hypothetical protein
LSGCPEGSWRLAGGASTTGNRIPTRRLAPGGATEETRRERHEENWVPAPLLGRISGRVPSRWLSPPANLQEPSGPEKPYSSIENSEEPLDSMQPEGLWLFGHFSALLARARSTWILPLRSRLESSLRESPSIFSFLLKGQKWPNCLQQMPCDLISVSLAFMIQEGGNWIMRKL